MEREPPARQVSLSRSDIAVIEEARAELRELPLPPAMGRLGCLVSIGGVATLAVWPQLLKVAPAMSFFTPFVMLFAIVVIIGGLSALVGDGQFGRNDARAAIEGALRILEAEHADREERLRAALILLERAYVSQGPSTEQMLDVSEARRRIGSRIELVLEVERYCISQHEVWPVFGDSGPPDE